MSLLSDAQKATIRAEIKKVTDTFFVTPVSYKLYGESIDRFNEDREDTLITTYDLNCLVEFITSDTETDREKEGGLTEAEIKVTLNYADAKAVGFADAYNFSIANPAKDYMIVHNRRYKVTMVYLDGPLEAENVLLGIMGMLDEVKS